MLSDEVCALRLPVAADADDLASCVIGSLPELSRWMPWATAAYDRDAALAWINGEVEHDSHTFVIVDHDGSIAGSCGLNQIDRLNNRANLGYWVRTDRTGRGLATAATRLVAQRGLSELGFQRLEILMAVDNVASRRVAERAGATFEGTLRARLRLHGQYQDAHMYSIVSPSPTSERESDR
jgi:RimJ/RimL family protein N-acetyltransferase